MISFLIALPCTVYIVVLFDPAVFCGNMTLEHEQKKVSAGFKEPTAEETAEAVKAIAKSIRESSIKMRETLRVLHKSGAIDELAEAVRIAALSTRDTAREIEEVSRDLKERGVFKETKSAVKDAAEAVRETEKTISESLHDSSKQAV